MQSILYADMIADADRLEIMADEIGRERYAEILGNFEGKSVLVFGDLMIDEYLRGSVRRISQESPVMVVEVEADEFKPGGAANVGNNLRALGASVAMAGVIGDDEGGRLLMSGLSEQNISTAGIVVDHSRPTTRKTRVIAQNQQVLRVDREQTHPVSESVSAELMEHVLQSVNSVDAVFVSDYRKGTLTQPLAVHISAAARAAGKMVITNPKPSSAPWLAGAHVLSLNRSEAEEVGRRRIPGDVAGEDAFGEAIRAQIDVDTLVITWGAKGLSYWRKDGEYRYVPAHRVEVADVAGAGDTTISAMTLGLLSGANTYESAVIANRAGALVVRKSGVAVVTVAELLKASAEDA